MPKRQYPSVTPGEWVQPVKRGYKMACCARVQFQAFRDNRATAALRRHRHKEDK